MYWQGRFRTESDGKDMATRLEGPVSLQKISIRDRGGETVSPWSGVNPLKSDERVVRQNHRHRSTPPKLFTLLDSSKTV